MQKKTDSKTRWVIQAFCLTFVLSLLMSFITTNGISNLDVIPAILVLILVIFIGIMTDIIGVAVTVADEAEFHAKATKKIKGAKTSIRLIRNASIVANVCADVIGDVCGVLSGAISAMIAVKLTESFGLPGNIQFLLSALVASLTVGGKAIGKNIANKESTKIVSAVGLILSKLVKEKQ